MNIQKCVKESFAVIGKEGSTEDGAGFIQRLWADANAHFGEVAELAKRDASGTGKLPAVFHKQNNCEILVTMELDAFMQVYREWESGMDFDRKD